MLETLNLTVICPFMLGVCDNGKGKGKGKVHRKKSHEGPEMELGV